MNKLTVLMPSYNKEEYIKEAIESVLMQETNFDFKLVVTDDGSTDKTIEIVNEYIKKYPEKIIILPSERNQGLLSNIIKGYEYLQDNTSEYFCVMDADDYYTDKHFYQKAIDFLTQNKEFTIYASNTEFKTETGEIFFDNSDFDEMIYDSDFNDMLNDLKPLGNTISSIFRNVAVNRELIDKIKSHVGEPYSEHAFREDLFRNRIHLAKGKAHYVNECVGIYRCTNTGLYQGSNELKRLNLILSSFIYMYDFFEQKHSEFMNLALIRVPRYYKLFNGDFSKILEYPEYDIIYTMKILNRLYHYDKTAVSELINDLKIFRNEHLPLKGFKKLFSIRDIDKKKRKEINLLGLKFKFKNKISK